MAWLVLRDRFTNDLAPQRHYALQDAHGNVACLGQPLNVDPIERMDGETGDLDEYQADQQHHGRARGETARPDAQSHARSTVAART